MGIVKMSFILLILQAILGNNDLSMAVGIEHASTYISIVIFSLLFSPISMLLSSLTFYKSRQYEYEADEYAALSTGQPQSLVKALKKLVVSNLSNLTPHPFKVWLCDAHPPILARLAALNEIK